MKLTIYESAFKNCIFDIDPASLNFFGAINGYDYNDPKSLNGISFVLNTPDLTATVVEEIKSTFRYAQSKPEDYIKVRDTFEDYESDKRPRITILVGNGSRGLKNPLEFNLSDK